MLLGRDAVDRWPDPQSALNHCTFHHQANRRVACLNTKPCLASISAFLQQFITRMLNASRRHPVNCQDLLADLAEQNFRKHTQSPSIATSGPRTPVPSFTSGSPPDTYFQAPVARRVAHSRYKEDWEELERLVSHYVCGPESLTDCLLFRAPVALAPSSKLVTRLTSVSTP